MIRHLMVTNVHGQFNGITGKIHFTPGDIASLRVDLVIDASRIITGIQKRDDHLKSQDFFDVGKYPEITFRSTQTERTGFYSCNVWGNLSIHGVTKLLMMEVTVSGPVKSPFGETTIGITGTTSLNREEFGLTWNEAVGKDGLMVGKEASLMINIEADLVE